MFRVIKELPGAPCGTVVTIELNKEDYFRVIGTDFCTIAFIPKADLHLWVSEGKPKGIEPMPTGHNHGSVDWYSKINELITAVNKLTGV